MADTKTLGAGLRQLQSYPDALQFVSELPTVDRDKLAALAMQMRSLSDHKSAEGVADDLSGVVDNLLASRDSERSVIERSGAACLNSIIDHGNVMGTLEHVVALLTDLAVIPELAQQGKIELARFDLLLCGCRDALAYELEVMKGGRHG